MRQRDRSSFTAAFPAGAIILIACGLPLAWMLATAITHPEVRRELLLTRFRSALLGRTLLYNGSAALIATAMGLPAALVLGRSRGKIARFVWVMIPAALLLPSLAYAYGWKQFVRLTFSDLPPPDSFWDVVRCIWSLAAWLWAVPAVLIGLSLRRLDNAVQQQALLDGALWRVTLRQLAGPVIASIAIVTLLATQEFAVYEPSGISVTATEVRMVFDTGSMSSADNLITAAVPQGAGMNATNQAGRAAAALATAAPVLLITLLLTLIALWCARRSSASEGIADGSWPPALDAPLWSSVVTLALLITNVLLPAVAMIASLKRFPGVSRVYGEFGPQIQGTALVAVLAAIVASIAAFSSAARWRGTLILLAGATFLIGGQMLAIAFIRIFNRHGLGWVYDSAALTVLAYIGRFGWIALAGGRATWSRPWREVRDMAQADGASTFQIAATVVWPLAWPMLLAGGLLVGALSLTEVPATVLLMPMSPQVLTPTLMTWVHMQRYDPMIEASLLMMGSVLIPAVGAMFLIDAGLRRQRRHFQRM